MTWSRQSVREAVHPVVVDECQRRLLFGSFRLYLCVYNNASRVSCAVYPLRLCPPSYAPASPDCYAAPRLRLAS